jgi:hypothetical protein
MMNSKLALATYQGPITKGRKVREREKRRRKKKKKIYSEETNPQDG